MQFCFSNLKFPLLFSIPQKTVPLRTVDIIHTSNGIGNLGSKYCESETKLQSDQKIVHLCLGGSWHEPQVTFNSNAIFQNQGQLTGMVGGMRGDSAECFCFGLFSKFFGFDD
jgi:hypothetical protein